MMMLCVEFLSLIAIAVIDMLYVCIVHVESVRIGEI